MLPHLTHLTCVNSKLHFILEPALEIKPGFAPYPPNSLPVDQLNDMAREHDMTTTEFMTMTASSSTANLMDFLPELHEEINWVNWPLYPDGAIKKHR